jgi:hypothetical protein
LILDEYVDITILKNKNYKMTFTTDEQLSKLNLGTSEEPHIVLVNVALPK